MPNTHTTLKSLFDDVADAIREKDGTSASIVADTFPAHIRAIPRGTLITKTIIANGTYNASDDNAYGYSPVTVNVPTGTQRTASDVTVSGATVSVPAGLYESAVSKSVASGSAGTPTATKGSVSNHSVTVTPKVTNTTGYITGGTKTGSGVTVSASELVSGSETKTENGTYDVTNLASVVVNVQGGEYTIYPSATEPSAAQNGDIWIDYSGDLVAKNFQISSDPVNTTSTTLTETAMAITVTKTGIYNVYACVGYNRNSGTAQFLVKKNGTTDIIATTNISTTAGNCGKALNVSLNAGDVLKVWLKSASSSYRAFATALIITEV